MQEEEEDKTEKDNQENEKEEPEWLLDSKLSILSTKNFSLFVFM